MSTTVRTRFAPSPTGALHIGGARTALFSWALAQHFGGTFVLRIEDTDVERSTPENVAEILDAMAWLKLTHDDGPYYQMQRMDRYREVIEQMLANGTAYHCYTSREELEAMREAQKARGEREKYDGTWRPEAGKTLPEIPVGVQPVVRFKNPLSGNTSWVDVVKGEISFNNAELDDLIIARPDGTPTYNFCVVVDDWDMGITHVIRGDDHVNNTPKQINILKALNAPLPFYGHIPMILAPDGSKLSKRKNATAVMDYERMGYLPEALCNYLARLGWGHGDDEVFTREQFVEWFSVEHLTSSSSQWDPKKLNWMNNHYINKKPHDELVALIEPRLIARLNTYDHTLPLTTYPLSDIVALYKSRCDTLVQITDEAESYYLPYVANIELINEQVNDANRPALKDFAEGLKTVTWDKESINALIKSILTEHGLKMPALGIPLRAIILGQTQSPSVDTVLHVFGRQEVLNRLNIVT
ncbi:Glutamate--tRNA ligase [Ephemeroptericola cinctiostellae]|uniref:Glutamate--tRNA ligase n=1 Tax=Ephemeroptericola cinctiostellae TaxID=2268024 RepID=A0A345DC24_9BURK|nr:glutamate--tRNA ligase [Ephemeroptericola cinctiostellae]AXF85912.1 Glutamate--tRNA ligase [Ephemeroptericola cinctiostellae]